MSQEELEILKNYLERKSLELKKYKKKKSLRGKHGRSLLRIIESPSIIGINEKVNDKFEYELFDENGKKVGSSDLILTSPNTCYLVEYKCFDSDSLREIAKNQLKKAKRYLPDEFRRENTRQIYIFGNFEARELVGDEWRAFN